MRKIKYFMLVAAFVVLERVHNATHAIFMRWETPITDEVRVYLVILGIAEPPKERGFRRPLLWVNGKVHDFVVRRLRKVDDIVAEMVWEQVGKQLLDEIETDPQFTYDMRVMPEDDGWGVAPETEPLEEWERELLGERQADEERDGAWLAETVKDVVEELGAENPGEAYDMLAAASRAKENLAFERWYDTFAAWLEEEHSGVLGEDGSLLPEYREGAGWDALLYEFEQAQRERRYPF